MLLRNYRACPELQKRTTKATKHAVTLYCTCSVYVVIRFDLVYVYGFWNVILGDSVG